MSSEGVVTETELLWTNWTSLEITLTQYDTARRKLKSKEGESVHCLNVVPDFRGNRKRQREVKLELFQRCAENLSIKTKPQVKSFLYSIVFRDNFINISTFLFRKLIFCNSSFLRSSIWKSFGNTYNIYHKIVTLYKDISQVFMNLLYGTIYTKSI